MKRASSDIDMDMDGWELLPSNTTLLDLGIDGGDEFFAKKLCSNPRELMNSRYFDCPSENSISADKPVVKENYEDGAEFTKEYKDINIVPQVLFIHNPLSDEFAKSLAQPTILFDEKEEFKIQEINQENSKDPALSKKRGKPCWDGLELRIWRWRINGFGALCTIGVAAAATICILILGGGRRQRQQQLYQNQMLQFQMISEEKRIKQMMQQSSRLNQAMAAMRSAPARRAQLSFGGYYGGL